LRKVIVVSYKRRRFALVNPQIERFSGTEWGEEGCLSIPRLRLMVPRATRIEVTAQTPLGKSFKLKERGYIARILQHEIDHLNGVLIVDKGTPMPDDDQ
jgi:peptide deformylase